MPERRGTEPSPDPGRGIVVWRLAFAFLALAGMASLWWPMGRDQGIFAWVGRVVVEGGAPYRDAWDVKGPATYLVYALSQVVFGRGMWGIRLVDLLLLAGGAVLAWRALRRLGAGGGALLGPWLFVAWYWGHLGYWYSAQPDSWIGLLLLAVLALIAADPEATRPGTAVATGALIGACASLKPMYSCLLVLTVLHAWPARGRGWAASIRSAAFALAGFAGVVGIVIGWLLVVGAMGDFLRIQFGFNWAAHRFHRSLGLFEHLQRLYAFLTRPERLLALPLAWVGVVAAWRRHRRFAVVALAATGLAVACIAIQGKYYLYHFVPILAPLALLAGVGIGAIAAPEPAEGAWRRHLGPALAATIVAVNLVVLLPATWSWVTYVGGGIPADAYYGQFGRTQRDFSFQECAHAARVVERATRPGDTVLVWGIDPLINYLSGRMPPTRFGVHYPLTRGDRNPFEAEWRRTFLDDLERRPPAVIVVADRDENNLLPKSSLQYLDDFPRFRSYLETNYDPETRAGRFYIWRRRPS